MWRVLTYEGGANLWQARPFTLGFVVMLVYLLFDFIVLRWRWQRDVHVEASGATQKTYQEVRDERFSKVSRYSLPFGSETSAVLS